MKSQIEEQIINLFPQLKPQNKFQSKDLNSILQEKAGKGIIYYSTSDLKSQYISSIAKHSLLRGYYDAYVNHCPICITPDILWMLVVQGFSRNVENNAEKLRTKFVNFEGKKNWL